MSRDPLKYRELAVTHLQKADEGPVISNAELAIELGQAIVFALLAIATAVEALTWENDQ